MYPPSPDARPCHAALAPHPPVTSCASCAALPRPDQAEFRAWSCPVTAESCSQKKLPCPAPGRHEPPEGVRHGLRPNRQPPPIFPTQPPPPPPATYPPIH